MTKADIVNIIAGGTGLTKVEVGAVIDGFLHTVSRALKENKAIELRGFGTFKVVKREARTALSPKTLQKINVPEKYVPVFRVSRDLKTQVNRVVRNKMSG